MKKNLFAQILEAYKVEDCTNILTGVPRTSYSWLPVGGFENNFGIIHMGKDSASGLIERITNAIDAVLEREWRERGCPAGISSPRQAAEQWFNIGGGYLSSVENIRSLHDLTERVEISLHDSDDAAEGPTVEIRDTGLGLRAEEFKKTILGLNRGTKLDKMFLSGAYGQGGSTALSTSEYTVIASRAMTSENSAVNPVAFTLVRYNSGDPNVVKHGKYEYMVDTQTNMPFVVDVNLDKFKVGTLVRHIAMDIGKYDRIMTAPQNSLYWLVHNYLFDPVLPFRIRELRTNSSKGESRAAAGNDRRLTHNDQVEYQRESIHTFENGKVTIRWWVLGTSGEKPRDRIRHYAMVSQPIVITFNGQRQGYLPNTIIKTDLKLPYLDRYLIVHIRCDEIDGESRRRLFSTTRESVREGNILDRLRELVVETLAADDHLKKLDSMRKARYLSQTDSQSMENIRRRLAERVRAHQQSGVAGTGVLFPDAGGGTDGVADRDPIEVNEPPTFLRIVGDRPRDVYPGRRFIIRFETDAHESYFLDPDKFLATVSPPTFGQFTGTTNVHDGYGTAHFIVDEDTQINETAEVTLELRPPLSQALRDAVGLQTVEPPQRQGGGSGTSRAPNINPRWVGPEDDYWKDNEWDQSVVASVEESDESVDIFVSNAFRNFAALLERAQRQSEGVVEQIKNFYIEHVAFHAYLAKSANDNEAEDGSEVNSGSNYMKEMTRVGETVCGIIEGMFPHFTSLAAVSAETEV